MGYALAEAAARAWRARDAGLRTRQPCRRRRASKWFRCEPPLEMRKAVMDHLDEATIIIKAAAVADYHVANPPKQKVKKTAARLSLELDPTPDILAEVGQKKGDRLLIGFAAETREPDRRSPPQAADQELRHGGGESGVAARHRASNRMRMK